MKIRRSAWAAALLTLVTSYAFLVPRPAGADAEETLRPVQLSLLAPVQLFRQDTSIIGLRLSVLYGRNENLTGLEDLPRTDDESGGLNEDRRFLCGRFLCVGPAGQNSGAC